MKLTTCDVDMSVNDMTHEPILGSRAPRKIITADMVELSMSFVMDRDDGVDASQFNVTQHRIDWGGQYMGSVELSLDPDRLKNEVRHGIESAVGEFLKGAVDPSYKTPSERSEDEQAVVEKRLRRRLMECDAENERLVKKATEREGVANRLLTEWQDMRRQLIAAEDKLAAMTAQLDKE